MNYDADIIIAGGGPAGLSAAILAADVGLRVALFEPKTGVIDKACGEGLMPSGVARLAQMGVQPKGRTIEGICYRDARDPDLTAIGNFPGGTGLGVRRTALHRALLERAGQFEIERIERKASSISQDDTAVEVDGVRARFLIAADGLQSPIRRELGLGERTGRRRFGVRRHYAIEPWSDRVEVFWADGVEAYITPVDDNLVGVAMLFEPQARFDELLELFPLLRQRIEEHEAVTEATGAGPFDQRASDVVDGRILLVGDAAGYMDPLTGEGVSLAAATAHAAVASILDDDPQSYRRRYRSATRRYFWLTRALLTLTRPRFVHKPLIKLLNTVPPVFDAALGALGGHRAA